jgi:hypothetical protein
MAKEVEEEILSAHHWLSLKRIIQRQLIGFYHADVRLLYSVASLVGGGELQQFQ